MAGETVCYTSVLKNSCKNENSHTIALWQFLLDLLIAKKHEHLLKWNGESPGEFKFIDAEGVAKLWGEKRNKPRMNYDKMSRALRYYYNRGFLAKVEGKKFVYRFLDVPDSYRAHVFGNKHSKRKASSFFCDDEASSRPYTYKDSKVELENFSVNKENADSESMNQNLYQSCLFNDDNNSYMMCSLQILPDGQYILMPNGPISFDDKFNCQIKNMMTDDLSSNFLKENSHKLLNSDVAKSKDNEFSDFDKKIIFLPNDCFKDMYIKNDPESPDDSRNIFNSMDLSCFKFIPSDLPTQNGGDIHFFSPSLTLPSFITSAFLSSAVPATELINMPTEFKDELMTPVVSNDTGDIFACLSSSDLIDDVSDLYHLKIRTQSDDERMDISDNDSCFEAEKDKDNAEDIINKNQKRKKYRLRLCVDTSALRSWIVH